MRQPIFVWSLSLIDMNDGTPRGGTELILQRLQAALPELTSQVQFVMSRPEMYELDPEKPRILWLQDLPQDPAIQCLRDPSYHTRFNFIVFASHWQQQQFNQVLGFPFSNGIVIKNGVNRLVPTLPKPLFEDKVRFIYTSTPHRGLTILAAAAEELAKHRQDWELHVYSSLNIYGRVDEYKNFEALYEQLRRNPCVTYHGSQPNDVVRQAVLDAHIFIYPNVYQETSCMAIQEAMMAGCLAITTPYGALIETCGEWAFMMPNSESLENLAGSTYQYMLQFIDIYKNDPAIPQVLRMQSDYFQNFYSFERRIPLWEQLLRKAIEDGPPVEQLVIQ